MSTFRNAVINHSNVTTTENGMKAYKSSLNANVDLFFSIAASRGEDITGKFNDALKENRELALRMLLWARDVRGGAGEREQVRNLLKYLEKRDESALVHVLPLIPEVGRWDDLLVFESDLWKQTAYALINQGLQDQNGLCAKWMPRKGKIANELRAYTGMTPKQYRKTLVNLSKTVEQQMCAKDWNSINFEHVPSVAASRYQKAFTRNCGKSYVNYRQALASGATKINANSIFPYDVLKGYDKTVATAQWNVLPNYMNEEARILPMVDSSSSMMTQVSSGLSALEIAVSLGLYTAEKQKGAFKDLVLSFSSDAKIYNLKGNLFDKKKQIEHSVWHGSTNIEAAFNEVLRVALQNNVPQNKMPTHIAIFSDMQFNCVGGDTANEMIKRKFESAGYKLPNIIFWNLADRGNNTPVKYNEKGVVLVSGFSPSLMKQVLSFGDITPETVMLDTLLQDRYNLA